MKTSNLLSSALVESSRMFQVKEIAKDVAEMSLDAMLDDGILRDIPVFSWLVATGNIISSVRDSLFLKKIATFLSNIQTIPEDAREEFIREINNKPEKKKEVGEKLLLLLDRMNDFEKARLLSIVFQAYVSGKIDDGEFAYLCDAVDLINPYLLQCFSIPLGNADGFTLANCGLLSVEFVIDDINNGFRLEGDPVGCAKPWF
jgi:hypothetical protein